jgi:hypothetical protein
LPIVLVLLAAIGVVVIDFGVVSQERDAFRRLARRDARAWSELESKIHADEATLNRLAVHAPLDGGDAAPSARALVV